jgi:hypothetical protein
LGDAWPQMPTGWTNDDTEAFLSKNALPADFLWPHRERNADGSENLQPVLPSYRLHKGYGFWLRTTPYFQGLFEEIHDVLLRWPDDQPLPEPEALAEILNQRRAARGTQPEFKL